MCMGGPSLRRPTALRNAIDEVVLAVGWAGGWQRRRKSPQVTRACAAYTVPGTT